MLYFHRRHLLPDGNNLAYCFIQLFLYFLFTNDAEECLHLADCPWNRVARLHFFFCVESLSSKSEDSLLTSQQTAVFPAPPFITGSVCYVLQKRGNDKMRRNEAVILVPSTTLDNGNAKVSVLMCNELNWIWLLGGNQALQSHSQIEINCNS